MDRTEELLWTILAGVIENGARLAKLEAKLAEDDEADADEVDIAAAAAWQEFALQEAARARKTISEDPTMRMTVLGQLPVDTDG